MKRRAVSLRQLSFLFLLYLELYAVPTEHVTASLTINLTRIVHLQQFLSCDAMHKCDRCRHVVSIRLSVCLSRSWIMSKRINISSTFFHCQVATPFSFFRTKRGGDIPTRTPLTGASNARGYDKMIFSQISRSISETVIVRWAHVARQFVSIEFSFHPYNI